MMDEFSYSGETANRQVRWVAMWQEAVGASPEALGLLDLSTSRVLEMSPHAADLFGLTPDEARGLDYLSLAERPRETAEKFRLVRERMIDGARGRSRYRRRDGSLIELEYCSWAIRSAFGSDLGLWWTRDELAGSDGAASSGEVFFARSLPRLAAARESTTITLDDHWQVVDVRTDAETLLGRPSVEMIGSSIIELVHPDDVAALLFAFARATTEARVGVRTRVRHRDGSWRMCELVPAVIEGDETTPFAVALAFVDVVPSMPGSKARSVIEGELLRIATELRAGMSSRPARLPDEPLLSGLARLTPRESEILARLQEGERVPMIAQDLFVSQSTVRHHLSSIFSKVGVHSQAELIRLLRAERSV